MIVWVNGSYGACKSTTAELPDAVLGESCIFDPEEIGGRIRKRGEEEGCWCMQQVERCAGILGNLIRSIEIDTDRKSAGEAAEEFPGVCVSMEKSQRVSMEKRQRFKQNPIDINRIL